MDSPFEDLILGFLAADILSFAAVVLSAFVLHQLQEKMSVPLASKCSPRLSTVSVCCVMLNRQCEVDVLQLNNLTRPVTGNRNS